MLISLDFWKSMHGNAMDYRTREICYRGSRVNRALIRRNREIWHQWSRRFYIFLRTLLRVLFDNKKKGIKETVNIFEELTREVDNY